MSTELIVADIEYRDMGSQCTQVGESIEVYLSNYVTIMNRVGTARSIVGATGNALLAYSRSVAAVRGQFRELMNEYKSLLDEFVREIDNRDRDLY